MRIMVRATAATSLALLGYATLAGTLRTVMYAAALRWTLPKQYRDRERIVAAIEAALTADGYS